MVRLEWADIEAFDEKTEAVLRPKELDGVWAPKLTLRLQPYVQLLDLHYPVDELLLEIKKDHNDADFASNAVADRGKRAKVHAVEGLQAKRIFLVVHRIDFSVYFRRIEREEYAMLSALRAGKSIAGAIELAFMDSSISEFDRAGYVRHCFETWAALGWFSQQRRE